MNEKVLGLVNQVAHAIERHRFHWNNETELQEGIAAMLKSIGIDFGREHILGAHSRIDFYIPFFTGNVGIEVKIQGTQQEVLRQVYRYADFPSIDGLVVVTTKHRHIIQPLLEINEKPVRMVWLGTGVFG